MIAYHGTSKDKAEYIVKNGFSTEFQGDNGSHFGKGVYLATTKKRAKQYGNVILTVDFDNIGLYMLSNWYNQYMKRCREVYLTGVPQNQVNTVVGEEYKAKVINKGYKGIIMDSVIGRAKEIVLYDASLIHLITREG